MEVPSSFFKVFVTLARFSATVPVASAAGELVAPGAAVFWLVLAMNAACARAYSNANRRTSAAV